MNFTVKNIRTQSSFSASPEQSILSAAIKSGIALPHSCRAGNCGSCKALLVSGKIENNRFDQSALTDNQRDKGYVLLCSNKALSDIEIDIEEFSDQITAARLWPARIKSLKLLCHDVIQMIVQPPPGQKIEYLAGQYVDFILSDNRRRSFSIANADRDGCLEFHLRKVENGEFTSRIFDESKVGDVLRLRGPLGTFFLRKGSENPIIMVAGGTGFAPIKALLEELQQTDHQRVVNLYWGVRSIADIYMKFWLEMFDQNNEWFNFIVVLSAADDTWGARRGLVHQAVLDDFTNLASYDIYASGPPTMITAARHGFTKQGLDEKNFYFDSFDYSPDTLAKVNQ